MTTPGHVFYERLNTVLNAEKFDQRVEAICRKYYKSSSGRPSITPGTYFRCTSSFRRYGSLHS